MAHDDYFGGFEDGEDRHDRVVAVGLGMVGASVVLGGLLYLIRRQVVRGDVLRVRMIHDIEPGTKAMLESYRPTLERLSQRGLDVNVRSGLFRRAGTG